MSKGKFINFLLDFKKDTEEEQANKILLKCRERIQDGAEGVGITYSANYGQTRDIEEAYSAGEWNTQTSGDHQAKVMMCMESLLGSKYTDLQGKMHILPITTMNAYVDPLDPWNEDVQLEVVTADLNRIKDYLERGWDVLGWQNQKTVNRKSRPYAVGEGVASTLPSKDKVSEKILSENVQNTLIEYASAYA